MTTPTNRRRRFKPGSHLPSVDALAIIKCDAELTAEHRRIVGQGYTLKKSVRPYFAKAGFISFQFVWRRRAPLLLTTWTLTWRVNRGAFEGGAR